ncbi:MAG: DUF5107 domain-containing protein [Caldilineaceae bacterium]|nr:DUF5107 domain-containing protein [Caldilineaceae bacterium]MBP8106001.1 DUF5107 domain-containing protein [Caldilineaceae bacterium]MBP8123687.1 DUF5107 domain-containing protein [Caldilineaceae bacterium]MBP9071921.1 DUF5107 domain-containing protein [Caldilineaceae bacterium]
MVIALTLTGCKLFAPPTPTPSPTSPPISVPVTLEPTATASPTEQPPTVPQVAVEIVSPVPVYAGNVVEIAVHAVDRPVAETDGWSYLLSIDGASTGWKRVADLPNGVLSFVWTASDPGDYEIIGQVRNPAGLIGEAKRTFMVEVRPTETPTEMPTPAATPMDTVTVTPTETVTPENTPTPTVTATPTAVVIPRLTVKSAANVRSGPGTTYPVVGGATAGQSYDVLAQNSAGTWLKFTFNGQPAWIFAALATVDRPDLVPITTEIPTPAPTPSFTPTPVGGSVPAPAPVGTVVVYESSVTLLTYPYDRYQSDGFNDTFAWPYKRFDQDRFRAENPAPANRTFKLIVLENSYLKVTILPELGGRIWQVIYKPGGWNMFYQNPVVKPSPWGPPEQLGWLAVGGMEWNLPVEEHGYDWGVPWGYIPSQISRDLASVTVFTPRDGRRLNASITISLRSGAGSFEIEPRVSNVSDRTLDFHYWQNAMLAPGSGNRPTGDTHFILPSPEMTVHSTQDPRMPQPGQGFSWPNYGGRDVSRLGSWNQFLGFFERPAAHGPFVGIYDRVYNAGAVRVYPANVARGSKLFGLGFNNALGSDNFTTDNSGYVELHGGLSATFFDTYRLPAGGAVSWREVWYPVSGMGDMAFANEVAAIHPYATGEGLAVGFFPTRPMSGNLVVTVNGTEVGRQTLQISPAQPFNGVVATAAHLPTSGTAQITFVGGGGQVVYSYTYSGQFK